VVRQNGLRIGTFAGAPVIIESTFLLLAAYVVGSAILRGGVDAAPGALILVGVVFAAIVIHEFGHAGVAAALNIPSRRIVLTFFGGYVQFARQPKHGWQEIAVSAAGPGANLASYILVASIMPLLTSTLWLTPNDTSFLGALNTFGVISLMLGLFNLLPGFPLDGGHILRAALSYVMQRNTARIVTAITGLLLTAALIAYAIWQELLWTVFVAGLLGLAAWAELRAARYERQRAASDTTSNA